MLDLSKMSEQQVFDTVYRGLASQGFEQSLRSANKESYPACMYRGVNGKKCAGGWLLSDEVAKIGDSTDGGTTWRGLVEDKLVSEQHKEFIGLLQSIHDDNDEPKEMQRALKDFAKLHKLIIPTTN